LFRNEHFSPPPQKSNSKLNIKRTIVNTLESNSKLNKKLKIVNKKAIQAK
jgi:hypothetical protein